MDLRQLRAFVAVAEERHFGRAAERLHIAQPPLSQTIKRLEAELGAPLLHRTTRRVDLAPAGEVLLPRAKAILAAVEDAERDARRAARGEFGRLSVGFTGSATYGFLPALAGALRVALPGVELDLHGELLTPAQVAGLEDGTLDIALLRPPMSAPGLALEPVLREPLVAVLPQGHRFARRRAIALADLAGEPFVTYPSSNGSVLHGVVERACAAAGFRPRSALEVAETATLVSFVAAGYGVSLVPASVTQMSVAGAVYRPLSSPSEEVELAVAWRRGDDAPVVARALHVVRRELPAAQARLG
jgi:DNA-binding transcriptional LysR family regulator